MTAVSNPPRRAWWRTAVIVAAWAALVIAWFVYQRRSGVGPTEAAQRLVDRARGNWWAIGAYVLVSIARPVVLFPASLVTIAAGMLFGPVAGVLVAAGAANASAMVAFALGRIVGPTGAASDDDVSRLGAWRARLQRNTFEAVLVMRLLFLPYDLVNYGCGVLRVKPWPFLAATAIGSLPGTVAFVLVGASIERLDEGVGGIDATTLAASVALIVVSIAGSRLLRRRTAR